MSVTFSIFLDKRRLIGKTQKYPLKLRVTFKRKPKEFVIIHELSEEDYNKIITAPRVSENLKQIRDDMKEIEAMMVDAIKKVNPFDFWAFNRDFIVGNPLFKQKKINLPSTAETGENPNHFDFKPYHKRFSILTEDHQPGSVGAIYQNYIKELIKEKRFGNAFSYARSWSSIQKFGGKDIRFPDITVSWLRNYEAKTIANGRSRASVGIVLRALRCIFNEANHAGIINKQLCYPFGRRKYLIPTAKKRKYALNAEDIARIYFDEPSCENERQAKSLWFFMYFGNGMNPKDLVNLKWKDIDGNYLTFYRSKTDLTARNDPKPITAFINDDMHNTIEMYGNTDRSPNNNVFPFLTEEMTDLERFLTVPRATHTINRWMKKIGDRLGLPINPTTIVTRYSFSTIMKRAGASTEFIQEALGHQDKKTTENYLGSFENEVKKKLAENLVAFKSNHVPG